MGNNIPNMKDLYTVYPECCMGNGSVQSPYSLIFFMSLLILIPQHIVVSRFKNMIKNQKRPKHNFKMYKFVKFYLITMPDLQN